MMKDEVLSNIAKCRVCGSGRLNVVFDMGQMPLANALRTTLTPNPRYPLTLLFCEDCSLVQIRETIDKSVLFSSDYLYYSSQSKTMVESARALVDDIYFTRELGPDDLVMEAASNDGYLLQHYVAAGTRVIGVDPATECAKIAATVGVKTDVEFFTAEYAKKYADQVSVFHANNVLAHTYDQNDFVRGVSIVLKDDGVAIIEVPYLGSMIKNREFDTIYHEHLCYFSLTSLQRLFHQHGLSITDVVQCEIHGGSLRIFVSKGRKQPSAAVRYHLAQEQRQGMHVWNYYADFGARANMLGADLWRTFDKIHRDDYSGVAGYGAAAKGNQLLSYFNIDFLDYVIDSTPAKQGKFMAGVDTAIVRPFEFQAYDDPARVLILAWNFKDEIMAKHPEFKGKWIVPIPDVQVV
jgi:SAM-dependent methyltransferase